MQPKEGKFCMTYKAILTDYSQAYRETERFYHFKDSHLKNRYYSNYLDYKTLPSLEQVIADLDYLKEEQKDYPLDYAMVFFPENEELRESLSTYLEASQFEIEKHLIFRAPISDLRFSEKGVNTITIERLSEHFFRDYLDYKYQQRFIYGENFAKEMYDWEQVNLPREGAEIFIARDGQNIIGDVTAWYYGDHIEMDDFSVLETYRGKGVGSALQKEASQGVQAAILISQEENRQMYEHQGYREAAHYWTAIRKEESHKKKD